MKHLLLIFLVIPALAFAQIPKHAKIILVKDVSFLEVCSALLDNGYTIQTKDNDLQTARTEEKQYPKYWNARYTINVRVKDSVAYFSGTFSAVNLFKNEPIEYLTNKKGEPHSKSLVTYPFLLLNDVALSLQKDVSYQ